MADELRPQAYRDPRPAEAMRRFHDWARANPPGWTYRAVRVVFTPTVALVYRAWALGAENVPERGPVILALNHFSNWDHFFAGAFLHRQIRFLAKSQLFGVNPALDYLYRVSGHFPVRRGYADDEAFITAHSILDRGGCVGIYVEGGRSRSGGLGEPKAGVGRLALESGAPVVPVALHGSAGVRGWRRLRFPKVTAQFAPPLSFPRVEAPSRERQDEAARRVFAEVRRMYEGLEARGRREAARELRAERRNRPAPGG